MKQVVLIIVLVVVVLILLLIVFNRKEPTVKPNNLNQTMKITNPAFANNQEIPQKYTCKGENVNPELEIEGIPASAKSLSLIMDDPDAPGATFVHWVVFNMPANVTKIPENSKPSGIEAKNSREQNRYTGPCPPSGTHRYFFKLYALDTILDASKISTKDDLLAAMQDHVLAEAELVGKFAH